MYRELGMIRCELEMMYDRYRKDVIFKEICKMPKDINLSQKKLGRNFILFLKVYYYSYR